MRTKRVETTREYDDKGNLIKETIVETEADETDTREYWQNPVIWTNTPSSGDIWYENYINKTEV